MSENLALWDKLGKTDPKHTKGFKRAGGFTGTALKPMWAWRQLTGQFGPFGTGWGCDEPTFQLVPGANNELLVYSTVTGWYLDGAERKQVVGVGGDKVITYIKANEQYNRPERWENDDEAFKKAFTDALMNAFKFVGVGADIHMGQFDDNKYVQQMQREFAEPSAPAPAARATPAPRPAAKPAGEPRNVIDIANEIGAELDEIATQFPGKPETFLKLVQTVRQTQSDDEYENWKGKNLAAIEALGDADRDLIVDVARHHRAALKKAA